ncbi:hypothetical protein [Mesorhizobium tianshanense]|uniref:hypothetical protein n=1 Tax=Mesorhizobium tianshanense TaxID=39844 RepID=UPI0012DD77CE|nr:hypothetical protein [Mesorhizobium tianshanense]
MDEDLFSNATKNRRRLLLPDLEKGNSKTEAKERPRLLNSVRRSQTDPILIDKAV